ncbi:MAG TPA: hypothetical protein VMY88_00900 [Acidimicrobiales bacterium]|nr:hypothetical protein [Acidimicrobiales bacterium]
MRRALTTAVAISLALALLVAGSPARAAEVSWADDPGDATQIGVDEVGSTPRPSDSQLDILKTSWSADGKYLNLAMYLDSVEGDPTASFGRDYRFYFTHEGTRWAVGAQLPSAPLDAAFIQGPIMYNDDTGEYLDCGCKAGFDAKTKAFTLKVSYDTFDRAFPGSAKVGPGTKFTELSSVASRFQVLIIPADDSEAPAPASFTF